MPPVTPPVQPTLPPDVDDADQGPPLSLRGAVEIVGRRRGQRDDRAAAAARRRRRSRSASASSTTGRRRPRASSRASCRSSTRAPRTGSRACCRCSAPSSVETVRLQRPAAGPLRARHARRRAPRCTIVVKARMLRAGSFESVAYASSTTARPQHLQQHRRDRPHRERAEPALRAAIVAPAQVRVGDHVRYRVSADRRRAERGTRGAGLPPPPAGLLVRSVSGARRVGDQLCRDVPRLRAAPAPRSPSTRSPAPPPPAPRLLDRRRRRRRPRQRRESPHRGRRHRRAADGRG